MREFEISTDKIDMRLDLFISENIEISRSQVKKLIDRGNIVVNGSSEKAGYRLRKGDIVFIEIPPIPKTVPENIPLNIIYEDNHIAIIEKEQNMVVHPGSGNYEHTLVNGLLYHFKNLAKGSSDDRPGIVHRLDKDTSGLMIICKSDAAYSKMLARFKNQEVKKYYYAIVHGVIREDGHVDAPIGRHEKNRIKMAVNRKHGKIAKTNYSVLENFENFTFLDIELITGRTHQIRVHLSHIHHPVVGDLVYGQKNRYGVNRQLLHAYKLEFLHPISNELLKFETPLPSRFLEFIKKIEV